MALGLVVRHRDAPAPCDLTPTDPPAIAEDEPGGADA
jgi:hypothetical protein